MTQIKGADGRTADVDTSNRLKTFSVIQNEDKQINIGGGVFSVEFSVNPVGANDYFFYFKNNGLKDLFLTDIRISSSAPTSVFYEHVTGTPAFVAESPASVTSRKLGGAAELPADAISDANITNLVSQGVLFFQECAVADTMYHIRTTSNIIIPQGQAVSFRREAATGVIQALVSIAVAE